MKVLSDFQIIRDKVGKQKVDVFPFTFWWWDYCLSDAERIKRGQTAAGPGSGLLKRKTEQLSELPAKKIKELYKLYSATRGWYK